MKRQLNDKDLRMISDFLNYENLYSDVYIKYSVNYNLLCRETNLRPLLFEGNFLFFGEIKNNKIEKLAMISLPPFGSKLAVFDICILSKNIEFLQYVITELKKLKEVYHASKIKVISVKDVNVVQILLNLGFYEELSIETNIGLKRSLVYLLD